jgi:TRAP-type mannitol/chloroaromatic compound transport system permease large subunit
MGVRTGVRCCGEAMAGGRGSAMVVFPLFGSPQFSLRHGRVAGCAIVTTWLVAWVLEDV